MTHKIYKMKFTDVEKARNLQVPAYIENESSFSYLNRLANANGFPSFTQFLTCFYDDKKLATRMLSPDCENLKAINLVDLADDSFSWFLKSSIYDGMSPFLASQFMTKKISSISYSRNQYPVLAGFAGNFLSDLKICPECLQEDMKNGTPYLRKFHQIPGVTICPEHGRSLLSRESREVTSKAPLFSLETYQKITSPGLSLEGTRFLQKIVEAHVEGNLASTRNLILQKMKDYCGEDVLMYELESLLEKDPVLSKLDSSASNLSSFLFRQHLKSCNLKDVIPLVHCIYEGNAEAFISDLKQIPAIYTKEQLQSCIPDGYELVSPYSNIVVELANRNTGFRFLMTPQTLIDRWPMPDDTSQKEPAAINKLIERKIGPEWKLLAPPKSLSGYVELKCDKKDGKYLTSFENLINFGDVGLNKPDEASLIAAFNKKLEKVKGYIVTEVKGSEANAQIRIRHKKCGNEFWAKADDFLKFPYCHSCFTNANTINAAMEEKVSSITNKYFIWKGDVSTEKFKAIAFRGSHVDVTASSCSELIQKLIRDKDGSKQESGIVKALEHVIETRLSVYTHRVFYIRDFMKYGKKMHVQKAVNNLVEKNLICSPGNDILYNPTSDLTTEDVVTQYFIDHNGAPVGDSLLYLAGLRESTERKTYVQYKKGHPANTTVSTMIAKEPLVVTYCKTPLTNKNRFVYALLTSLENTYLSSTWDMLSVYYIVEWVMERTPKNWESVCESFSEKTVAILKILIRDLHDENHG